MDIKKKKCLISFGAVFLSSLIMAFATKNLVRPAGILSGGFMGIAIMIDMIAELIGHNIPTSIGLLFLNIPVALFCAKKISPRFVFFSLLQVGLTSLFGFEAAGYSILFQFMSTKTVSNFHTRYKRVMMQIFTKNKDDVMAIYCKNFHHGITALDGMGGYSKTPVSMLTAIVSSYEVDDVVTALKEVDPKIIINVSKSEKYVGRFYNAPL